MLKVETGCKQRTHIDYRNRWNVHLKAVLGRLTATQVDRDKVVAYLNRRMKGGAGLCARNREQRVLMMLFGHNKPNFRRSELLGAKVGYFNPQASALTLPAFTTKNKIERVVDINPSGEIFKMLVKLTEGREAEAALFTRNGRPSKIIAASGRSKRQTFAAAPTSAAQSHSTIFGGRLL
jgi:hypothetical protein